MSCFEENGPRPRRNQIRNRGPALPYCTIDTSLIHFLQSTPFALRFLRALQPATQALSLPLSPAHPQHQCAFLTLKLMSASVSALRSALQGSSTTLLSNFTPKGGHFRRRGTGSLQCAYPNLNT